MKYRHYAPKGQLTLVEGDRDKVIARINELVKEKEEEGHKVGVIGTDETLDSYHADILRSIGSRQKPETVAANLYRILREFDDLECDYAIGGISLDYRKIIIVGENNIGRSFMAECILRGILQKRNCQNIEVVSRGLVVLFSEPVAPGAAKILREKGYRIEDFRSSQLTDEDLASADLVLAITKGLAEEIKESFDEATSCMGHL